VTHGVLLNGDQNLEILFDFGLFSLDSISNNESWVNIFSHTKILVQYFVI